MTDLYYKDENSDKRKYIVPLLGLLLCAGALAGLGFAYASTVELENNIPDATSIEIDTLEDYVFSKDTVFDSDQYVVTHATQKNGATYTNVANVERATGFSDPEVTIKTTENVANEAGKLDIGVAIQLTDKSGWTLTNLAYDDIIESVEFTCGSTTQTIAVADFEATEPVFVNVLENKSATEINGAKISIKFNFVEDIDLTNATPADKTDDTSVKDIADNLESLKYSFLFKVAEHVTATP